MILSPFNLAEDDMELFQHYMMTPDLNLSEAHAEQIWMKSKLPCLAFPFRYVLHLILAYSGFHMSAAGTQLQHTAKDKYRSQAEKHYEIALREVASSIPCLDKNNCVAIYGAVFLMCLCTFAKGPQPGDYFSFSANGKGECLTVFKGIQLVIDTCANVLSVEVLKEHANTASELGGQSAPPEEVSYLSGLRGTAGEYTHQLEGAMHQMGIEFATNKQLHSVYCSAFSSLLSTFDRISDPRSCLTKSALWPNIFGWLYSLPDAFVVELQERKPMALVAFAFFAVLLRELEHTWLMRGWSAHILAGVYNFLDDPHRQYIQWPMTRLGSARMLSIQ